MINNRKTGPGVLTMDVLIPATVRFFNRNIKQN